MSDKLLLRIQDKDGRGPWRPGFSHRWVSPSREIAFPPPAFEDFPDFQGVIQGAHKRGLHIGIAVRGFDLLANWFMPEEMSALRLLGYRLVRCNLATVLEESQHQVLIAHSKPLATLPRIAWPHLSEAA